MKQVFIAAVFFLIAGNISAQNFEIERQTLVYEDTLALDVFYPKQKSNELRPLLIYVHGGGFSGGNRGGGIGYCDYFAKKGWVTATISYHLTMKGQSFSCGQAVENKINTLFTAAQNVNQATAFLLEKSKQFNIDPSKVVIAGSSAGAEAVLQAAYWKKSQKDILSDEFICRCGQYGWCRAGSELDYGGHSHTYGAISWYVRPVGAFCYGCPSLLLTS